MIELVVMAVFFSVGMPFFVYAGERPRSKQPKMPDSLPPPYSSLPRTTPLVLRRHLEARHTHPRRLSTGQPNQRSVYFDLGTIDERDEILPSSLPSTSTSLSQHQNKVSPPDTAKERESGEGSPTVFKQVPDETASIAPGAVAEQKDPRNMQQSHQNEIAASSGAHLAEETMSSAHYSAYAWIDWLIARPDVKLEELPESIDAPRLGESTLFENLSAEVYPRSTAGHRSVSASLRSVSTVDIPPPPYMLSKPPSIGA